MAEPTMRGWSLSYEDFDPSQEALREALTTLGNGYIGTRGAAEEADADDIHYPGTYLAGGYNRLETEVAGRMIENEDLVNFPNWLSVKIRPDTGDWFNLMAMEVLSYRQELHLDEGILERTIRFRDPQERETTLRSQRLVHMGQPHYAAIRIDLVAENWSGKVHVHSALDGRVINHGVPRYRQLNSQHLEPLGTGLIEGEGISLHVQTTQSQIRMAQAARTRVYEGGRPVRLERHVTEEPGYVCEELAFHVGESQPITIEKSVAVFTSRDSGITECLQEARNSILALKRFDHLKASHVQAWRHIWRRCDVVVEGDEEVQMLVRLHMFHILQTVSPNTRDLDFSVPARGLHGEAYRGHVFWDELFVFPVLNLHLPEITRAMLLYRYRRLPAARWAASQEGLAGAMFPWQSGSNGREESQLLHLNPKSGRWLPDDSRLQRHVNLAIAYNVWRYFETTDDLEFLSLYGAELLLDIARFWSSMATYNDGLDRYEIAGVMGPDEYHERYPDARSPGFRNNAYTNVMVAWLMERALRVLDLLDDVRTQELIERLDLGPAEIGRWREMSGKMHVPFHGEGIISQFEGYDELEEFDWDGYREKYGNIQRLDRILEAEGDTPNRYKLSKQADVVMLFYLLSEQEIEEVFGRLGHSIDRQQIRRNIEYYMHRTSHGSTLSQIVHAAVLARIDPEESWERFMAALRSDLQDIQGGTTAEGIHTGVMAGTVDILERVACGLTVDDGIVWLDPRLPEQLTSLTTHVRAHRQRLEVHITRDRVRVASRKGRAEHVRFGLGGEVYTLAPGESKELLLGSDDGGVPEAPGTEGSEETVTQAEAEAERDPETVEIAE